MKGLLIKDLMLLKSQGRFFAVTVILIFIAGGVFDGSYAYFGYYLMLFQALFVVNTMSMDEENGGMCFLMTLPAGRKAYVREKFCFGMLMTAAGWALSVLIAVFFMAIKHDPADLTDLLPMAAGGLAVFPMINFVSVPLILKFGQEKGRIALAAVFMGLFGGLLPASSRQSRAVLRYGSAYASFHPVPDRRLGRRLTPVCGPGSGLLLSGGTDYGEKGVLISGFSLTVSPRALIIEKRVK